MSSFRQLELELIALLPPSPPIASGDTSGPTHSSIARASR